MKKKTPVVDSQALPPEVRPGQSVELLKQLHIPVSYTHLTLPTTSRV